uniref:60S ribosomal protein L29 n=1 Tax=Oncorhynchus kisutch TaxID=8019 RepID=A0A8C7C5L8_ONCKI
LVEYQSLSSLSTARKAHRNGIKKPRPDRYESMKGVGNCKVMVNIRVTNSMEAGC